MTDRDGGGGGVVTDRGERESDRQRRGGRGE